MGVYYFGVKSSSTLSGPEINQTKKVMHFSEYMHFNCHFGGQIVGFMVANIVYPPE